MELQRKLLKNKNFFSLFRAIDRRSNCLGARTAGGMFCVHTCGPGSQTDVERECYGVVVDLVERRMVSYMGKEPLRGTVARTRFIELILESPHISFTLEEALEGELLSVYSARGRWMVASRGCTDIRTERPSLYASLEHTLSSHFARNPVQQLCSLLDPANTYQFVLAGGKHSPVLGGKPRLLLVEARRQKDHAAVKTELDWPRPRRLSSFAELEQDNSAFKAARSQRDFEAMEVSMRGVCVRVHSNGFEDELLFFESESFRYVKSMKRHVQPPFLRYLELYRAGNLHTYMGLFPHEATITVNGCEKKVTDLVYIFYQSLASELFNVFKRCVNMATGELNRSAPVYLTLPPAYRRIVVQIRNRMQRFRRIHYSKFSYRYVLDLLKDSVDLSALAAGRNAANRTPHRSRTRQPDLELVLQLLQPKN